MTQLPDPPMSNHFQQTDRDISFPELVTLGRLPMLSIR
jgi:hypothetical protein